VTSGLLRGVVRRERYGGNPFGLANSPR
jgi:hypothetical protein